MQSRRPAVAADSGGEIAMTIPFCIFITIILACGSLVYGDCGGNPMSQIYAVAHQTGRPVKHVLLVLSEVDPLAYESLGAKIRHYAACVGRIDTNYFKRKRISKNLHQFNSKQPSLLREGQLTIANSNEANAATNVADTMRLRLGEESNAKICSGRKLIGREAATRKGCKKPIETINLIEKRIKRKAEPFSRSRGHSLNDHSKMIYKRYKSESGRPTLPELVLRRKLHRVQLGDENPSERLPDRPIKEKNGMNNAEQEVEKNKVGNLEDEEEENVEEKELEVQEMEDAVDESGVLGTGMGRTFIRHSTTQPSLSDVQPPLNTKYGDPIWRKEGAVHLQLVC